MGSSSKASQSTSATQTTVNSDTSANAANSFGGNSTSTGSVSVGGRDNSIVFQDLSLPVALGAIDLSKNLTAAGADLTKSLAAGAVDLQEKTQNQAFDYLTEAGNQLLEFSKTQTQQAAAEKLANQSLTADLAQKSFDMANAKTMTQGDQALSFAQKAVYIVAAIAGAFLLWKLWGGPAEKSKA